jgi:hypothetical protein
MRVREGPDFHLSSKPETRKVHPPEQWKRKVTANAWML